MNSSVTEILADVEATEALGARLAAVVKPGDVVYLMGDLGAGKTTLVRGLLRALGYSGAVKSPTYTLIESYSISSSLTINHLDLYRLVDPEELEWVGARDLFSGGEISLIEWPGKGAGFLPAADITIQLDVEGCGRQATIESMDNGCWQRV